MPAYEVEHVVPLSEDQKDQLAEAITRIHSTQFNAPRLFVNVRITDTSKHQTYVAGKRYKANRIFGTVRHGPSRTKKDYDAVSRALEDEWNRIVPEAELRVIFFFGSIVGGLEAGLLLPPAGEDREWAQSNRDVILQKAKDGDEAFQELAEQFGLLNSA